MVNKALIYTICVIVTSATYQTHKMSNTSEKMDTEDAATPSSVIDSVSNSPATTLSSNPGTPRSELPGQRSGAGTPRSEVEVRNTPPPTVTLQNQAAHAQAAQAVAQAQAQAAAQAQQQQMQQARSIPPHMVMSHTPMMPQQPQSKYASLLAVIEDMGKDIRPTYAGSKTSAERLKRGIVHARILVRECLMECERSARS